MMTEEPKTQLTDEEIALIKGILEKQQAFYLQIFILCEEEGKKFDQGRPMSEIFPLIRKRKILFSCAEEFEEKLQAIGAELKVVSEKDPNVKETLAMIQKTLKALLDLDKENQEKMKTHLKNLKTKQIHLLKENQTS